MSEQINLDRRRFFGAAAVSACRRPARPEPARASAQSGNAPNRRRGRSSRARTRRFAALKQIEAGVLNVGYAEAGPADGPPVILLHGWPYDIHSLRRRRAAAGRGGLPGDRPVSARLRHDALPLRRHAAQRPAGGARGRHHRPDGCARRSRRPSSPASTGARGPPTSSRRSGRSACKALVSVSGYLIGSQEANKMPLPPKAELQWWYQYYFATERGRAGYEKYRRDFARLIWQLASPKWNFDDATFERSAASLRQSGSRRDRDPQLSLAARPRRGRGEVRRPGEAARRGARSSPCRPSRWKATPTARRIRTPAPTPGSSPGKYAHRLITGGIGHNLPQEAPQAFAEAVIDADRTT